MSPGERVASLVPPRHGGPWIQSGTSPLACYQFPQRTQYSEERKVQISVHHTLLTFLFKKLAFSIQSRS